MVARVGNGTNLARRASPLGSHSSSNDDSIDNTHSYFTRELILTTLGLPVMFFDERQAGQAIPAMEHREKPQQAAPYLTAFFWSFLAKIKANSS
ncbi:hypothetical protein EON65_20695 [archaeon]|nr:MAG: hypothetical protein EON65_20695 [archaeon]